MRWRAGRGGSRAGGRFAPLPTAPFCLTACRLVAGSSPNATEPERRGDPGQREPEAREGEAVSGPDYEEDEEYEETLPVHQYIVDDLIRGESASPPGAGAGCEVGSSARRGRGLSGGGHRLLSDFCLS